MEKADMEAGLMEDLDVSKKISSNLIPGVSLALCSGIFIFFVFVFFGIVFIFLIIGEPQPIYHLQDAMLYSSVAYCENKEKIKNWSCSWCKRTTENLKVIDIIEDSTYDSLVYVAYNTKYGKFNFS